MQTPVDTTPAYGVLRPGRLGENGLATTSSGAVTAPVASAPASSTKILPKSSETGYESEPPVGDSIDATQSSNANASPAINSHTSASPSNGTADAEAGHHRRHLLPFLHRDPAKKEAKNAAAASAAAAKAPAGDSSKALNVGHGPQELAGHVTPSGNHLVPGMDPHYGSGYSGTAAASGDISAPTGSLPAGTVERGATNQPIPRPSPKDLFLMHNSSHPTKPRELAHRPVHQDPIFEADHIAPSHGGHAGNPGNMTSSFPTMRTEPVDPYAAHAHGDHLVRGLDAGIGYAGTAAANGDISAPTGSLPAGTTELGATGKALPRPSPKDFFKMSNASSPSSPRALAHRPVADNPLGPGTDVQH